MLKLLKNCDVYAPKHLGMRDILLAGDKIMKVAEKIEGYEGLDGVEVMNGNPRHNSHNEDAASFCRANGLVGLSGSDFHEWEDLAIGGLDFAGPVPDGATLVARLRAGEFVRICAQKGDA